MKARPRILVVDDDATVLEFVRIKFGARYDISATPDPQQALALARERRPNLILCDIEMPGLDGGDLSAAFFAEDEVRDIPILFLTGLVSPEELKAQNGQLGGRPAISKDASVAELGARIESLLR